MKNISEFYIPSNGKEITEWCTHYYLYYPAVTGYIDFLFYGRRRPTKKEVVRILTPQLKMLVYAERRRMMTLRKLDKRGRKK